MNSTTAIMIEFWSRYLTLSAQQIAPAWTAASLTEIFSTNSVRTVLRRRKTAAANLNYTNWQLEFPDLRSLDVIVRVFVSLNIGGPAECDQGRVYDRVSISNTVSVFHASKTAKSLLRPKTLNVEVKGFIARGIRMRVESQAWHVPMVARKELSERSRTS